MNFHAVIRAEAESDMNEAFEWYESKRAGLGFDFLLHIHAGIKFIERNPNIYKSEYKGTKKHIIKRFPYKIIYLVEKESIIILAIIHSKRNPELLKKKLKSITR